MRPRKHCLHTPRGPGAAGGERGQSTQTLPHVSARVLTVRRDTEPPGARRVPQPVCQQQPFLQASGQPPRRHASATQVRLCRRPFPSSWDTPCRVPSWPCSEPTGPACPPCSTPPDVFRTKSFKEGEGVAGPNGTGQTPSPSRTSLPECNTKCYNAAED